MYHVIRIKDENRPLSHEKRIKGKTDVDVINMKLPIDMPTPLEVGVKHTPKYQGRSRK